MKIIYSTLKVMAVAVLLMFVSFVVYANLEPAPLHTYVKPIDLLIVDLPNTINAQQESQLATTLNNTNGITANVLNTSIKRLSVTYHKDEVSALELKKLVSLNGTLLVKDSQFDNIAAAGPQCPVPMAWLQSFENAKYALCFR